MILTSVDLDQTISVRFFAATNHRHHFSLNHDLSKLRLSISDITYYKYKYRTIGTLFNYHTTWRYQTYLIYLPFAANTTLFQGECGRIFSSIFVVKWVEINRRWFFYLIIGTLFQCWKTKSIFSHLKLICNSEWTLFFMFMFQYFFLILWVWVSYNFSMSLEEEEKFL